jgi:hypothetical protein
MSTSLDRLRIALKFSLWTWALYWPGGGLLLLLGGLDPISIVVTFTSLAAFLFLLASGALKANSSRNIKQFFVERPLYLVAALVVLIVVAAAVPQVEAFGLLLFATMWFGGLGLTVLRLRDHLRTERKGVFESRADQLLLVLALAGFFSLLVFLDALLPMVNGQTTDSPSGLVAVCTWMNLLYPAMVMVAARPFREPIRVAFWRRTPDPMAAPAPAPVAILPASAAAAAPAVAARRRKDRPFRAS